MTLQSENVAHAELVGSGETALHSHAGGGATIKCGTTTTNGNGDATVTFGVAFGDTNYFISLTCQDSGDTNIAMYSSKATTGFDVRTENDQGNAEGSVPVDWVAIHL
jgi:hypothetical protein